MFATAKPNHHWNRKELAFPALNHVPRITPKRRSTQEEEKDKTTMNTEAKPDKISFKRVGISWGSVLYERSFVQMLNIVAKASGINQSVMGNDV